MDNGERLELSRWRQYESLAGQEDYAIDRELNRLYLSSAGHVAAIDPRGNIGLEIEELVFLNAHDLGCSDSVEEEASELRQAYLSMPWGDLINLAPENDRSRLRGVTESVARVFK